MDQSPTQFRHHGTRVVTLHPESHYRFLAMTRVYAKEMTSGTLTRSDGWLTHPKVNGVCFFHSEEHRRGVRSTSATVAVATIYIQVTSSSSLQW